MEQTKLSIVNDNKIDIYKIQESNFMSKQNELDKDCSHYSNLSKLYGMHGKPSNAQSALDNHIYLNPESVIQQHEQANMVAYDQTTSNHLHNQQNVGMLNNYLNSLKSSSPSSNDTQLMHKDYVKHIDNSVVYGRSAGIVKPIDRLATSRSHPDLSKSSNDEINNIAKELNNSYLSSAADCSNNYSNAIEVLLAENVSLRNKLALCLKKVEKLQKVRN